MNRFKMFSLFVVSLLCASALHLQAKTVKYPEKDPTFSFTLPDGWTTKPDKDGNLDCQSGDGSKFSFSIVPLKGSMKTADEVTAYLPTLAEKMATGANMKDVKVGEVKEGMMPNKFPMMGLNATGTVEGTAMIISLGAFAAKKGDYYVLMGAETAEVDKAHEKVMGEILESIKPLAADEDE